MRMTMPTWNANMKSKNEEAVIPYGSHSKRPVCL